MDQDSFKRRSPVAWRVKDAAGEWVLFTREADALRYKAQTGGALQGLYVGRDAEAVRVTTGEEAARRIQHTQDSLEKIRANQKRERG